MTKITDQAMIDRLAEAARKGKISRRSFMHRLRALPNFHDALSLTIPWRPV